MASLIKSVKAFGEKATGQKINGNTLVGVMKDMGQKMTGKEIKGNSLLDIIDATTEDYAGGGAKVVAELPKVGEEHTVYELQETKVADFPWLLTEFDISEEYPVPDYLFIVVETEEQVTQEYLAMPGEIYNTPIAVFVKNTNNVYECYIEDGEQEDMFVKTIVFPEEHNLYGIGEQYIAILKDFDYHVATGETEEPNLDGTGHFLDGAEFNYDGSAVPLVLTDATNKKISLTHNLVGGIDVTDAPLPIPEEDLITKIDLSILDKKFTIGPVFAPQSAHTEITYWIYANNTWTNTEDIGKPVKLVYGELLKGATFDTDNKFISPYTNEQICNYIQEGKPVILRYHNEFNGENEFMYVYINGYDPAEMAEEYVNQPLHYDNFTCREYTTTDRIMYNYGSDYFYYEYGE